jgi:FkbM family methyltransferase
MTVIANKARALCVSILRRGDLELRRYSNSMRAKRARVLREARVSLVLDVGANVGQYAHELRSSGYSGRIVSFEPLPDVFDQLSRRAVQDPMWETRQLAIGERDGDVTINVAGNSVSSSVLRMAATHEAAAPSSAYVDTCVVPMARLDSIQRSIVADVGRVHLKLDVQGYEVQALRGATSTLARMASVEAELSLLPLYEGQSLMPEVVDFLYDAGFQLIWLERGFVDPRTSYMLQFDGLFVRASQAMQRAKASAADIEH